MIFDLEQKQFPSAAHQAIWNCIRILFPLEKSLQDVTEEPLRSDCIAYYHCLRNTYEDMYEHPEQYHIPVEMIDLALNGAGFRQALTSAKWHNDVQRKKTLNLISRVRYLDILRLCLVKGKSILLEDDRLVMSPKEGRNIIKNIDNKLQMKPNTLLCLLQKSGFGFTFDTEHCYLQNTDYPGVIRLLMQWRVLYLSQKTTTGNPYVAAYAHADFRALLPTYSCSFEDAITPMYQDQKQLLRMLDDSLRDMNIHPKCTLYSASYVKKGKQMLAYCGNYDHVYADKYADKRYLRVPLVRYPSEELPLFETAVNQHPDAQKLIDFVFRHLILCKKCGSCPYPVPPSHLGRVTPIFGQVRHICAGNIILGFSNLQESDIPLILELIRIKYSIMQRNKR